MKNSINIMNLIGKYLHHKALTGVVFKVIDIKGNWIHVTSNGKKTASVHHTDIDNYSVFNTL